MMSIKEKLNDYKDAIIGNGLYDLLKNFLGLVLSGTVTTVLVKIVIDIINNKTSLNA